MSVMGLVCRNCGADYPPEPLYTCFECFGPLEPRYEWDDIEISRETIARGPPSIWRYRQLLPVDGEVVDLGAGFTRFIHAKRLGNALGLRQLYLIDDSTNPTYSFKDRVVSVAVSKALEFGMTAVGCASTGNLAGSLAAHAAVANLPAYVFIPKGLEKGKLTQALVHGAHIIEVDGTYDDANRLATECAEERDDWGFVNINLRPYYAEGSKTLAYEAAERLGWTVPDQVVVPVASGALLCAIHRGFAELEQVGLVEEASVKFNAAQPEGFPVARAIKEHTKVEPIRSWSTLVHSLAIGNPADGTFAKKVVEQSGGYAEDPSDLEAIEAIKLLASTEGVFTELAGGITIAALKRLVDGGRIDEDEVVVAYLTGNGLKTPEALVPHLSEPIRIDGRIEEVEEVISCCA
ncbi:threonine synthase [Methermicoccus shengliensis]|uniref:Threonine synthase n=1 Tax=Methermicoccus shengliensis TaxID=660064 RepID=A0A832VXU3_9EURY|nr:threonine synthase [Methermicoccus shengliensis]KUK04564.1 MAG: Threonine synthase [Euryarchaeota archaeon 55_53]MDN5294892.1 threonine synthase [Methanosarcinales archaeon]HIH70083.1 threonine synthase [Methermicoccus shengliensis]